MDSNKIMFIVMRQSSFYSFFPLGRYNDIENKFSNVRYGGLVHYETFYEKENSVFNNQYEALNYYSNKLDKALKSLKK